MQFRPGRLQRFQRAKIRYDFRSYTHNTRQPAHIYAT